MSWDAMIFNGKDVPPTLADVPRDWRPHPIGGAAETKSKITSVLTGISWDDAGYGSIESPEFAIEFHVRDEEEVDSIGVRVVGGGNPIPVLVEVCRANGWVAFDNQAGDLLDMDGDPSASWREFIAWRDRAMAQADENTGIPTNPST